MLEIWQAWKSEFYGNTRVYRKYSSNHAKVYSATSEFYGNTRVYRKYSSHHTIFNVTSQSLPRRQRKACEQKVDLADVNDVTDVVNVNGINSALHLSDATYRSDVNLSWRSLSTIRMTKKESSVGCFQWMVSLGRSIDKRVCTFNGLIFIRLLYCFHDLWIYF